jgi:dTDP-4-dehydrorhamnose reductase
LFCLIIYHFSTIIYHLKEMKNILITGANGQLGNEMRVLSAENKEYTYFFTDVAELDICNAQAILDFVKANDINVIVNCAAYTAVDKAEESIELCTKLNADAVGYLAEAAEANGAEFIQISTDYVFDGTAHTPYQETEPTCPNSVYGYTKLAGEQNALTLCSRSMVIRTAWLYSTFGNNFVKTMIRLGKERDSLGVIFDQIGTPTYARDLARAIFAAIRQGVVPGIYHFSNEGVCSWYDFTKAIHRLAGITTCQVKPLHTEEYPTPAKRPHYSVLDKSKIKATFGIEVPYWEESLQECIYQMIVDK